MAVFVHLTSTRPSCISTGVTPNCGVSVAIHVMLILLHVSLIHCFAHVVMSYLIVSILTWGPQSWLLAQLTSGLNPQNQGYPRIKLSFPMLVT